MPASVPFYRLTAPPEGYPFVREYLASRSLLTAVKSYFDDLPVRRHKPADPIVLLEVAKACNLSESILALCLDGYGPAAEMLLRPMWEAVVTAAWVHAHPLEAEERYALHRKFALRLHWARRKKTGLYSDSGEPEVLTQSESEQANKLFGQYGQRSWTGRSMRDMTDDLVASIVDAGVRKHLHAQVQVVQPFINWMLHSSGLGFWRFVGPADDLLDQRSALWFGPSDRGVRDALNMSWNQLLICIGTYDDHFDEQLLERLNPLFYDVWASFKDPDVLKSIGRNDLCPCQSGAKYKNCHERLR